MKLLAIIQREYMTRVRTKGFLLGTFLMPIFLIFITVAPTVFMAMKSERPRHIAVIDITGEVYPLLVETLNEQTRSGERLYQFRRVQTEAGQVEETKLRMTAEVDQKIIHACLIVPADVFETNQVEYHAVNVSNFRENAELERAISRVITRLRLERSGLVPDQVDQLVKGITLAAFKVGPGGTVERDVGLSFGVAYIMIFVLYLALIMYGAMTMRSIVEDKNNRVIEVLLAAVKPFELMAGKILGIGAVGLTQFLIWAGVGGLISLHGTSLVGSFVPEAANVPLPSIPISQLLYFVLFFVLGFIFYSTMYAGIGAMVNSDQEAQQFQWPVVSFLILAFMLVFYTMGNPDSTMSVVLSLLPMFSPILMFMRISVQTPPPIQIAASIIILVLSIWVMIWLVARIFRVGILMYGKRPNVAELLKWMRYG